MTGLLISILVLFAAHLFRMKFILFAIDMGDYNAAAGGKDGEA